MIVLILFDEIDEKTGRKTGRTLVSHGVNVTTLENIPLPPEPPERLGKFNQAMQEWILK